MAALVVGADLGLGNSSLQTLGLSQGSAAQGQGGDGVYVNLGTGNLVLQQQDELLLGLGLPSSTLRTYNSQGLFDGDNNDNWRIGFYRQLGDLSGVFGTANSSITRTAADGASERYVWDASRAIYLNRDGAGTYRTLARQANGSWRWQDGSGASEIYQSVAGSRALLREQRAGNGVVTWFQYAGNGLLSRVLGANGEFTELVYDSTPGRQANLLMLRTGTQESPLKLQTRVRYAYDDLNRLAQVTVDLSPQDNDIADGRVVTTRYSYEGASLRLSTLKQSDGANFSFGYDELERIVAVTDALGALTRYDYGPGHVTVIDPLGQFTTYSFDGLRRLTRIDANSGVGVESRRFEYNAQGDVAMVVEADGAATQFEYDAMGNLVLRRDAQGEVRMRYNAQNQLLSETRQSLGRPDAALVTRYVYDVSGLRLRFVISAEGRVTQYRYNTLAMRESSVAYAGKIWVGADLPNEAAMLAWVAGMTDSSQALRTDYGYDFRGQLASSTVYTQLDSAGNGLPQTGATTRYVYDAAGRLLQTIAPEAAGAVTSQVYDALGRVVMHTNALGQSSSFLYLEQGDPLISGSSSRIVHTAADGSISSTVFDAAGRLVASIIGQGAATAITRYSYDANNRLRRSTDATGVHSWMFYDALGRKSGQLDGNGGLTEYRYDGVGRPVQTIRYAQAVSPELMSALWTRLPQLDEVRPLADARQDQVDWIFYGAAGRPGKSVGANGAVTENFYDETGRLQSVRRYANPINTATLNTRTRAEEISVISDAALDRNTRYFYDRDGLLRATLDAEGYLTETLYDGAGRAWQTVAYALASPAPGGFDLQQVRPPATGADIRSFTLFDARGQVSGEIDGEGYLSEFSHDANGNRILSRRYATPLAAGVLAGLNSTTPVSSLRPLLTAHDQSSTASYDALNRVLQSGNAEGTQTRYGYDVLGRLVSSTTAWGSDEARTRLQRFDGHGLLLAELDGEGSAALDGLSSAGGTASAAQIEAVWERHGTRYRYDLAGRRTAMVDANGNATRYFYDNAGNLRYTVNALGQVQGSRYDSFGQLMSQTRYATAFGASALAALKGGVLDAALESQFALLAAPGLDRTQFWHYKPDGSVAASFDELLNPGEYRYNAFGERIASTVRLEPGKSATDTVEYDRRGQVLSVTRDAEGKKLRTTTTWDARGLMLSRTEAAGSPVAVTTVYAYDEPGRRISQTVDPNGMNLVTRYVWNGAGQQQQTIDPAGQITRNLYDAAGRLQARIDPTGELTVWRHDAEGRQTVQLGYSKRLDLSRLADAPSLSEVMAQLDNMPPTKVERTVYDRDGRVMFQIDALAQVTRNEYDGNGNLVRQTRYATPVVVDLEPQAQAVETALAAVAGSEDRVTRLVYDACNRLVYSISAMDTVTAYQRDAAGNVVQEIAYANSISLPGLPTETAVRSVLLAKAAPTLDRKTTTVFDAAGRSVFVVDALGYVVEREFDAAGRVLRTIRHASPLALTAIPGIATLRSLLPTAAPTAVVETQTWDAVGRLVDSTDGLGVLTHRDYDAAGRLTELVVAYGTSAAVHTHYGYDRAGNLIFKTEAALGADAATTLYRYDALGNVLTEIHALGVELADQDTQWALEQRIAYGVVDTSGQAKLAAALSTAEREGLYACYSTRREYDALGRVVRETDHQGGITLREYDAFGNLSVLTDPRGNSGSFIYDALDRVVSHANPLAQITNTTYSLGGEIASSTRGEATTGYVYDKLDRLVRTTDAEGHVESQTWDNLGNRSSFTNQLGGKTIFSYDQLGRKLTETLPIFTRDSAGKALAVVNRYAYDARGNLLNNTEALGSPEQRSTSYEYDATNRQLRKYIEYSTGKTLVEARVYDARGNLIETRDANGQRNLAWYDERNRQIAELDAEGTLTTWRYNAGEQALAKTVYGDALALPVAGAALPTPVNAANRRETQYGYDRKQRLTATIIRSQTTGRYNSSNGQYQLQTGDLVTRQVHDACGNVVAVIDAHGNVTRTWYDAMGQKILALDAEGYGIAWRYDGNGRVLTQTRFANRNAQSLENRDGASLVAAWPASVDDRITKYQYDLNGRVLEERQVGVAHGRLDSGGGLTTATSSDAITRYDWNGLSQVTQKTLANGEVSNVNYDLAGRAVREQAAAFVDFEGATVRPTTDIEYDGLGNVRQRSRRGKNDASTSDDQITSFTYGLGGRLLRETDAMGAATDYTCDAAGNILRKTRQRSDADGAMVSDVTTYRYDAKGREIEQTDVGTGTSRQTRYNAWGEVSERGTNGGWQEFVEYDAAGRVFKTNTEDGVTRAFVYDAVGNATLKIESSGSDLRPMSLAQMLQAVNGNLDPAAFGATGVHLSVSAYDKRNQLTDTWEPKMVTSRAGAEVRSSTTGVQVESASMGGVTVTAASSDANVAPSGASGKTEVGQGISVQIASGNVTLSATYLVGRVGWGGLGPIMGTASIYLGLPAAADAWGSGNFRVEVQSINLANGAVSASTLSLAADIRTAKIAEVTVAGAAGFRVAVNVYKTLGNGSVLLSSLSLGVPLSLTAPPPVSGALPKIALVRPATGKPVSMVLYYRASGSSAPFQSLRIPAAASNGGPVNDTYALDWGALPRASYEVRVLAVGTDGAVLDFQSGSMTIGDSANFNLTPANYGPAAASSLVFETGNLLQLTAQGSAANSMVVHYRAAGSNAAWNSATVLKPSSAESLATPGWFSWNYGQLSGDYEVVFESHKGANGDGELINKVYATLRLGGAAPAIVVAPVAYEHRPSTIHFSGNPLDSTNLVVRYRVLNSGAAWSSRSLTPTYTGSGAFGWDASDLVPYDQSSFLYEFEYETRNASGLLVNKGGGSLRLGVTTAILSQTVAPPSTVLRFTPQAEAASMRLYYRARNSMASYAGPISLARGADGSYSWDAMALKPATGTADFEYFHELIDAHGQTLGSTTGYFSLGMANSANALQWVINGVSTGGATIHRQQRINAFAQVVQEIDGLGRATDFSYNTLGLLTQKLQTATTATLENGYVQTLRPETRYTHDLAGHAIAEQDANGRVNAQAWLAGGFEKTSLVRQADGGIALYAYDVFGNLRSGRDALGRITTYEYDSNNRLTSLTRPQRDANSLSALAGVNVERYEYDEAGKRIAHTNALGQRERNYYDSLGRITRTLSFESRSTSYDYRYAAGLAGVGGEQAGGFIKTTTDANGRTLVDSLDMFGRTLAHQDLGGHSFSYRYNHAGWLVAQTGSTGQDINYEYYANGLLRAIRDLAAHTLSSYEYDAAGNRIFEGYALLGNDNQSVRDFAQQASIEYDALNRVQSISDPRYTIRFEYDATGNRRRMLANYHDGVNGSVQTQDYWYAYDAVNRFTTTMGSLSGARATSAGDTTVSIQRGRDGVQLAYDLAGQRRQAIYQDANGVAYTERYTYTADGYLEDTSIDNILRARRKSDALGRVTSYSEYDSAGGLISQRTSSYDGDNLVKRETTLNGSSTDYHRLADGTVDHTISVAGGTTTSTWYGYEWWDSARQSTITAQPYNAEAPGWQAGTSHLLYDINGHLKEARDEVGQASFSYTTNAQGLILTRAESMPNAFRLQKYYYVDGKRVGDVGNGGPSRMDYVQALARGGDSNSGARSFKPISSADFDQNYEPINASYPAATSSTYIVRAGDSLRSIAGQVWGDSAMWYVIADANGLTGSEALTTGLSLTIPNKVSNIHNSSDTFRVYNPGEAIGDIVPSLPLPPPPPSASGGGGCGGFAMAAVMVVVIAMTVYATGGMAAMMSSSAAAGAAGAATVGAAAAATAATTAAAQGYFAAGLATLAADFGVGTAIMAGAVGGAVGSLAGQMAGMALGVQSGLDWKGVATGAIGTAVSGGLAGPLAGGGLGMTVARSAVGNILTQGLSIATDLQSRFDWTNVATTVIGSSAGWMAGNALGMRDEKFTPPEFSERLLKAGVSRFSAIAAAALARGDRLTPQQLGVDALGSALGDSIVNTDWDASGQQESALTQFRRLEIEAMNAQAREEASMGLGRGLNPYGSAGPGLRISAQAYTAWSQQINAGIAWEVNKFSTLDRMARMLNPQMPEIAVLTEAGAAMAKADLPPVKDLYRPIPGFFQERYSRAVKGMNDPGASVVDKAVYLLAGAAMSPMLLLEGTATELYNAPNNASKSAQSFARYRQTGDANDLSAALFDGGLALLGAAAPLTGVPLHKAPAVVGSAGRWGNGSQYQRGAISYWNGEARLFENQLPNDLAAESRLAQQYGIKATPPVGPVFDAAVRDGPVKFVLTESGDLLVIPKFTSDGKEISHAVIAAGRPVRGAGEAEITGSAVHGYFGLGVTPHSGHYLNGASARQNAAIKAAAEAAFGKFGIRFPKTD